MNQNIKILVPSIVMDKPSSNNRIYNKNAIEFLSNSINKLIDIKQLYVVSGSDHTTEIDLEKIIGVVEKAIYTEKGFEFDIKKLNSPFSYEFDMNLELYMSLVGDVNMVDDKFYISNPDIVKLYYYSKVSK